MSETLDQGEDSPRIVWGMTTLDREASDGLRTGLQDAGLEFMLIAGETPGGSWPPPATVALVTGDQYQSRAIESLYKSRFQGPVVVWRRPGQHGHMVLSADDQDRLGKLETIHVRDQSVEALVLTIKSLAEPGLEVVKGPLPAATEIITLQDHWDEIAERFLEDNEELHRLRPRQFEEFTAGALEREGWIIQLTKETRDGGYDILAWKDDFALNALLLVECKRNAANNKVRVGIVRSLFGVLQAHPNTTSAMVVTTSTFTQDAKDWAEPWGHRLVLRDVHDLSAWVRKVRGI
jgi:HJR/Mrr/RecB family endonuclease